MSGLEIGGGNRPFRRDFEQLDAVDYHDDTGLIYTIGDARTLPYPDYTFPHVYASNILEHFPFYEVPAVLSEWARVLQVGGILEVLVPDAMGILYQYFTGRESQNEAIVRIFGTDGLNEHKSAFTWSEFHNVITNVPGVILKWCNSVAEGAGIHVLAIRVRT